MKIKYYEEDSKHIKPEVKQYEEHLDKPNMIKNAIIGMFKKKLHGVPEVLVKLDNSFNTGDFETIEQFDIDKKEGFDYIKEV
jgi:hypothetical protein